MPNNTQSNNTQSENTRIYGDPTPLPYLYVRIVMGRVVEVFRSSQEANASEDQEHIHCYKLDDD